MPQERRDPYHGYCFRVEIDDLFVGGFSEVSGLQKETQLEEIREGGVNDHLHRLPRETKYGNLVLKRGLTDSEVLWKWCQEVGAGIFKRKTIHVILLDREGNDVWRWSFTDAYPVKWSGAELKGDANGVFFEAVEMAHNGFQRY